MDIETIKKDIYSIILQSNIIPQDTVLKDSVNLFGD